eukprot:INCI15067.9.p2 GENE.INCI15067.9~~INCI15067.9.p2  ORF type:complete len:357 (+),score=104.31 INCI15067.9:365-1435(+)
MSRTRTSVLSTAGHSLTNNNNSSSSSSSSSSSNRSNRASYALSEEFYDQKRLDEQQAHHKRLLQQRLDQKRGRGGANHNSDVAAANAKGSAAADPRSDPDHPDNVRKRAADRQRQEKVAQKRLELKRREAHRKAQLRAQQRRASQGETVTLVRNGKVEQSRELTTEERKARLKARQEMQRKQRREEAEANYNPFDPNSRQPKREGDIWDLDDETDAMLASAGLLHEISASSRASPTRYERKTSFDDLDDPYSFSRSNDRPSLDAQFSLGSFENLLAGIDNKGTKNKADAKRGGDTEQKDEVPMLLRRPATGARDSATDSERPATKAVEQEGKDYTEQRSSTPVADEELDDLLNDIL